MIELEKRNRDEGERETRSQQEEEFIVERHKVDIGPQVKQRKKVHFILPMNQDMISYFRGDDDILSWMQADSYVPNALTKREEGKSYEFARFQFFVELDGWMGVTMPYAAVI